MAALVFNNFVGLSPKSNKRALGSLAAQINSDLLGTSSEFQPLQEDKSVASINAGVISLNRMARNAAGELVADAAQGWVNRTDDVNFVKSQLNDDATERTVVAHNLGQAVPMVIDAKGNNRKLGVPAPASLTASLKEVKQFTKRDALAWVDSDFIPAVAKAFEESLDEARINGSTPLAGATELLGTTPDPSHPGQVYIEMPLSQAEAKGLNNASIDGYIIGQGARALIHALPLWGVINKSRLVGKLTAITNPKDGKAIYTSQQAGLLADELAKITDPNVQHKDVRAAMDALLRDFQNALNRNPMAVIAQPTPPTKPTVPEYIVSEWSGA